MPALSLCLRCLGCAEIRLPDGCAGPASSAAVSSWGISVHMAAAGPAIGLRHGSRVRPRQRRTDRRRGSIRIRRRVRAQRPLQALPQVRQRRADILERSEDELFLLLGRLLLLCSSLGFFLLLGLFLCLPSFPAGAAAGCAAGPAMTVTFQLVRRSGGARPPAAADSRISSSKMPPMIHSATKLTPPFRRLYGSLYAFAVIQHAAVPPPDAAGRRPPSPASPADPPASSGGTPGGTPWWCGTAGAVPAPAAARTPR